MTTKKRSRKWSWPISILALIVFLDLCALTWYFWAIPEEHFENWKKIVSTVGSWLGSILTFFGIRYKFKREQSFEQVLRIRPVQMCIIAFTILIWFFVLPFHSISISVHQSDTKGLLSGVIVKVDKEEAPRPTFSDENGKIKIGGLHAVPHNLHFELDGYMPTDVTTSFVEVISPWDSSRVLLEKAEGTIELRTIPDGAEIFLEGEDISVGVTPKSLRLPTGKHMIRFKKNKYHPTSWEEISIISNDNPPFVRKLEMITLTTYPLTVSSDPLGAQIYVDGVMKGMTFSKIKLTAGEHMIEIRKSGYKPAKRVVIIPERDTITFNLEKDNV